MNIIFHVLQMKKKMNNINIGDKRNHKSYHQNYIILCLYIIYIHLGNNERHTSVI